MFKDECSHFSLSPYIELLYTNAYIINTSLDSQEFSRSTEKSERHHQQSLLYDLMLIIINDGR